VRRFRFLVEPGALEPGAGAKLSLPPEEARHIAITLRATPGEEIQLFDGRGREFLARIETVAGGRVEVVLESEILEPVEAAVRLVLLQGFSKDEAFERAVDQATALGVAAIVPLLCERSRGGLRPPDARRLERWRRIAREAAKLSWRRVVPTLGDPEPTERVGAGDPPRSIDLLLDADAPRGSFRRLLHGPPVDEVRLAVGPEGGFSAAERAALLRAGFVPVSMGPRILRTENAGAAALAVLLSHWGDIG